MIPSIPGSIDYFLAELEQVKLPSRGPPVATGGGRLGFQLALRRAMSAPVLDQVGELAAPLGAIAGHPTFALWATLAILVLAVPVIVVALLVAVFT